MTQINLCDKGQAFGPAQNTAYAKQQIVTRKTITPIKLMTRAEKHFGLAQTKYTAYAKQQKV